MRRSSSATERAPRPAKMAAFWGALIIVLGLLAHSAAAAELAILSNGFSIRHEHHLTMGSTTRLFFTADDSSFTDLPTAEITGFEKDLTLPTPALIREDAGISTASSKSVSISAPPLSQVVDAASATYHLDPDLVNSVIHAESGFNAHAVSPKGARGLMQLMPGTATELGVTDAFDPEANVTGGSRYLRELLEHYNFDLIKALAAYNAGSRRVEQYQGMPPFRETRAYVARIVHEYNQKKIAQEKAAAKLKTATSKTTSPPHVARKPAVTVAAAEPSR
jgi:soluble lytic murein transglycosylase-like protein